MKDVLKRTIIYIDDSGVEREIVRQLLEEEGFEVLATGKPEEGIDLARDREPDLVLVDLHLPGTDGCAVVDRLREIPSLRRVPVVALSASIKEEEREEVVAKFDGFLKKPVDVEAFPREIMAFIVMGREESAALEQKGAAEGDAGVDLPEDVHEVLQALEKIRAAMSHDLRTPLTVMISYASTVSRGKVGDLTDRQKEMLELVVDHGFQMDALIAELVRIARETLDRYDFPPK